jgi:putative ABC transport system permease protein
MVVIYQILFTNVADHLREYATLKAMGFSHRDLAAVVMQQGFILSLLGFPPGLLVSLLLMKFSRFITGMPFNVSIPQILLAMILTMAICFAAGYLALQKLKQADPADVFA